MLPAQDNRAFGLLKSCVADAFNAPTTAMVLTGNTDTRHYWDVVPSKSLCDSQIHTPPTSAYFTYWLGKISVSTCGRYRFTPIEMDIDDLGMFHGANERCASLQGFSHPCAVTAVICSQ